MLISSVTFVGGGGLQTHVCVVRCSCRQLSTKEGLKETYQCEGDESLPPGVGDSLVGSVLGSVLYLFCWVPSLYKVRGYCICLLCQSDFMLSIYRSLKWD